MKNVIFISILLLFGCSGNQSQEEHTRIIERAIMEENSATVEFNGKIPSSNKIITLGNSQSTTWQNYDSFYKEELKAFENEHYYSNLQWITLSRMIKHNRFLEEADSSQKLYYLKEMLSRNYVNQPELAVILLNDLKAELTASKIAEYARLVYTKNKEYLTEENFDNHQKTHSKGYIELNQLGWTRHGEPK